MNKLLFSLQVRFIVGYILILWLSLGGLILFANLIAEKERERFQDRVDRARDLQISQASNALAADLIGEESSFDGPVWADLGTTWSIVVRDPDRSAWGTTSAYVRPGANPG